MLLRVYSCASNLRFPENELRNNNREWRTISIFEYDLFNFKKLSSTLRVIKW